MIPVSQFNVQTIYLSISFVTVVLNFYATAMLTWNCESTFASDFGIDPTKIAHP